MAEWLPIESAPKDGTRLLLIDNLDKWVYIGLWGPHVGDDGLWIQDDFGGIPDEQPDHWMPVPAAPTEAEAKR